MKLEQEKSAVLLIDVQERLFSKIFEHEKLQDVFLKAAQAFQILQIPIYVTEQYPKGLGETVKPIKRVLGSASHFYEKNTFSAVKEPEILPIFKTKEQWILMGLETHICVLQSAFDLIDLSKEVIVLQDAVGSRDPSNKKSALEEMGKKKIRISCLETLLFELLGHAKHKNFKSISQLLR